MFAESVFQVSQHARAGGAQLFSEFVATFGLLCVIWGCARLRSQAVPLAVGLYITGAYWFTASTSFANPAVTLARAFTNTFAGIRPTDVPGFIAYRSSAPLLQQFFFAGSYHHFLPKRKRLCFRILMLGVNDHRTCWLLKTLEPQRSNHYAELEKNADLAKTIYRTSLSPVPGKLGFFGALTR